METLDQQRSAARHAHWIALLVLCALVLGLERSWAEHLRAEGALSEDEILFDADPWSRLQGVSHNWLTNVQTIHPLYGPLFATPIRAATSGVPEAEREKARRNLGLWVSPMAGVLKLACLFGAAIAIGLPAFQALLLVLLAACTFSQVLFGALPETYGVSGLGLCAAHWQLARDVRGQKLPRALPWILLGAFVAGITVTNIAPIGVMVLTGALAAGHRWLPAIGRAAAFGSAGLVLGVGAGIAGNAAYGHDLDLAYEVDHRRTQVPLSLTASAPAFVGALVQTFAPPSPVIEHAPQVEPEASTARILFHPELPGREAAIGWLCTALVALGLLRSLARGPTDERLVDRTRTARFVGQACAIIVLGNAGLHCVWGSAPFLYSQHWHASVVLLIGVALVSMRLAWIRSGLLVALISLVAWHNLGVVRTIESLLPDELTPTQPQADAPDPPP